MQACKVTSPMPNSLQTHGLEPARLLCPWDSPGNNTGVGCHFLPQRFFPTQESNPGIELRSLAFQADSLLSEPLGKPMQQSYSMCVCVCVCVCVHMYMCVHICTHVYTCTRVHTCMCVNIYTCICVCTYIHTHVCVYAHTYTCMCVCVLYICNIHYTSESTN